MLAQQERNARLLLKRRDHAAHAGGRVLQRLRGGGQTSGLNGADERAVAIEFHGVLLCEIVKDGLMDHRFTQSVARVYAVVVTTAWDELTGEQILKAMSTKDDFKAELIAMAAKANEEPRAFAIYGRATEGLYHRRRLPSSGRHLYDLRGADGGIRRFGSDRHPAERPE